MLHEPGLAVGSQVSRTSTQPNYAGLVQFVADVVEFSIELCNSLSQPSGRGGTGGY